MNLFVVSDLVLELGPDSSYSYQILRVFCVSKRSTPGKIESSGQIHPGRARSYVNTLVRVLTLPLPIFQSFPHFSRPDQTQLLFTLLFQNKQFPHYMWTQIEAKKLTNPGPTFCFFVVATTLEDGESNSADQSRRW